MNYEQAAIAEFKSIPALNNHVYPLNAPEKVRKSGVPYLILVGSDGVMSKTLSGYVGGKTVQAELVVVASTYPQLKSLTGPVISKLISFEGRTIGDGGPFIQELTYYDPVEFYESEPDLHRCNIDYEVFFEEVDQP